MQHNQSRPTENNKTHSKETYDKTATEKVWFSHVLWHPVRKCNGSSLSITDPTSGLGLRPTIEICPEKFL